MKTSHKICDFTRYFSCKGKNSVANATVLVAISSPEQTKTGKKETLKKESVFG